MAMNRFLLVLALLVALAVPNQASADPISDLLRFEPPITIPLPTSDDPSTDPIHRVTHDNMDAWKIQIVGMSGSVDFVPDTQSTTATPCTVGPTPLGSGSLRLFVGNGEDAAQLRSTRYQNTRLIDLEALGYSACANFNNGQQWPYIILNIDLNGDAQFDFDHDDLIFFEPAYQNAAEGGECGALTHQGPEQLHVWQQWDALDGFKACYWSLNSIGGATPGTGVKSLGTYITAARAVFGQEPAIVNASGNRGGIRSEQGFSNPVPHEGFVDGFMVQKNGAAVTYDFDPQ